VETCRDNAKRLGVEDQTNFSQQNYLATSFPDNTFDVVWAIESVCYAWDKADFTREAFRILKPGGRLVVADFFAMPVQAGSAEDQLMKKWTDAWAIKAYARIDEFNQALSSEGFKKIQDRNITKNVTPSIRRLYLSFFPGLITTTVAQWFGARNQLQTKNTWSTYYQYQAFKKHLWEYHIFSAEKS
jgi:ubiquinone/menaquinone biosynthesis C-methylase UbiE